MAKYRKSNLVVWSHWVDVPTSRSLVIVTNNKSFALSHRRMRHCLTLSFSYRDFVLRFNHDLQPAAILDDVIDWSRHFRRRQRILLLRDAAFRRLRDVRFREKAYPHHAETQSVDPP